MILSALLALLSNTDTSHGIKRVLYLSIKQKVNKQLYNKTALSLLRVNADMQQVQVTNFLPLVTTFEAFHKPNKPVSNFTNY